MKKCLIVVDYQNDFVTGSLGSSAAVQLEGRIAQKIQDCRERGEDILFTLDTHGENYLHTSEGKNLPIPHCIAGTDGHKLYGAVGENRRESDFVFPKGTFGSDALYAHLKGTAYTKIELVGVVTNICVLANAVLAKTARPEAEIIVDASCVASGDPALHQAALSVMESMQIQIINKDGVYHG